MIINQLKNGYRYNSDTMFLYNFIRNLKPYKNVLDVGCGSGILGLLIKRDFPKISLTLLDILQVNIDLSRKNAYENRLEADFVLADFAEFKSQTKFDFIISNPPFYHDGAKKSQNEHIKIAKHTHFLGLSEFISVANSHLSPRGTLVFCYDAKQLSEIFVLLKEFKLNPVGLQMVYSKRDKEANLVILEAKKSSKSLLKILPPLFVFEGAMYSSQASEIFSTAATQSKDFELC
ncbi:MAG: tRNA1(Val) (adenine(37)-N6)-methyltransferase [Campylobacter sp.]